MKNRILPIIIICIVVISIIAAVLLSVIEPQSISTVSLNEIKTEVEKNKSDYSKIDNLGYNFFVIENGGELKYSSSVTEEKNYEEWLNFAYQNDCIVLDYSDGKICIFRPQDNLKTIEIIILLSSAAALSVFLIFYWLYLQKNVFKPFKKLQRFAGEVAAGNLDSPLLMDKLNAFGAFSESFDILRTELKKSKENEIRLEKSKKELVASLSHDIKTPIASIKAVTELLTLSEKDAKKQKNIEVIRRKTTEIDNLITDMFNVTLQDLSELKFNICPTSSLDIESAIKESDYLQKIKNFTLPQCLIEADFLRLKQITDNIINNSYKYSDTKITLNSKITNKMLELEFRDYGKGIADEELPLITNKFYRGKNAGNKSGAGLGLYICKTMLERMDGKIDCYNTEDGFAVKIFLKLS